MHRLLQDLRYAVRTLVKSPGFTLVALLTLALAIGANTAIFSFVNAVILKPLPYAEPERILRVLEKPPGGGRNGISTLNFLDWQRQNQCFEFLAARTGGTATLTGTDEPTQLSGSRVSARYFDVFGVKAALGRTFQDGEDQPGREHVVILTHTAWQVDFGGDLAILQRSIQLDGEPYTVVGVLPPDCSFERGNSKIFRPLAFRPEHMTRNFHWFGAVGRLKSGVSFEQATAQMDAIGEQIAQDFPDSNKGWGVFLERYGDGVVNAQLGRSLYVLLGAVGMVLLIACANLANLSLLRVVGREREIALRVALGAGRGALVRQFLSESLLLSLAGGGLGLGVGHLAMQTLKTLVPRGTLPAEANVELDPGVMGFAIGLSVLTGLVIGLLPAWQAARPNLTHSLKQGAGGASHGGAHRRIRAALVVGEIGLAFVLLAGAGLLIRSLDKLNDVNPGFDATNVLTFRVPIPEQRFPDGESLNNYLREIRTRVAELPGVTDVAGASALPMQGWGYGMPFLIADQPFVDRANRKSCFFKMVTPSYFPTLRMRLGKGRYLADTDRAGAPPVAVINETMAKRYFADVDPLGKRILVQQIFPGKPQLGEEIGWEVVGVVANEVTGQLADSLEDSPGMYVTQEQSPVLGNGMLVRAALDPMTLRDAIKRTVRGINRDQTLPDLKTLDAIRTESLGSSRLRAQLLGIFAGLSLLLAALGIYGVISFSVSQRTREIGIRSALGARRGDIVRLVLGHGLLLAGLGLVVGIAGTFGVTRLLATLLFGVSGYDPATFAFVAVVLLVVVVLACVLPARRAANVDPLVALRCE